MQRSPMRNLKERIRTPSPAVELDDIDITLLTELAKDARIPQRALAATLGLSAPSVADRIARLKSRGVIRGFQVNIDWDAIGYSTVAYLTIVAAAGQEINAVIGYLDQVRGVEEITSLTGATDLIVKIRARGFEDLRALLAEHIWDIDGVLRTETSIALIRIEPQDSMVKMIEHLRPRLE
ncbi:Lrp/AsnC family transcriptional regulator [Pseudarthrobacter sp. fls2-241-R2A-168]|uniref:Lrp/AsnC family transcriptional regulator n=1 Tax=Pseudarthrobacter sp. fls2-241-R2A-168 TaxID=3040304 RepID=UPI00255398D8|nr:Lrp/AsnC family transcriptional regulator [Pseudarthrobacter sp. fls2-241-R2A-168]